ISGSSCPVGRNRMLSKKKKNYTPRHNPHFTEKLTMPMPQRVQYPDEIEPLVQFIEDTPPSEIVDRALAKLREGVPTQTMLMASALAVTRSTEMPPGDHGGPFHPLAALYEIAKRVETLDGTEQILQVVPHV